MTTYKHIFFDRQFRVWVGVNQNLRGDQIGDCEYFPNKKLATEWKQKFEPVTSIEAGSMCDGIGKSYF